MIKTTKQVTRQVLICLLISISSCHTLDDVRAKRWKYVDGYHISDLIDFDQSTYFTLDKKGNIYIEGKRVAIVSSYSSNKLIILSAEGQLGFYSLFDKKVQAN